MAGFLRDGEGIVSRVAVAYEPASSDQAWAETVADAVSPLLSGHRGVGVSIVEHAADLSSARYVATAVPPRADWPWTKIPDAALSGLGIAGFRALYFPRTPAVVHREVDQDLEPEQAAQMRAMRARMKGSDSVGVVAHPVPGVVVALYSVHGQAVTLAPAERRVLSSLSLHLAAAFRIRRNPSAVRCVLDADGRLVGGEPDASTRALARHAAELAGAHARGDAAALELWPALVEGRFTVARRGRRFLFIENPPAGQAMSALSKGEVDAVTLAAKGHPNKLVAYGLGISAASASRRLDAAARKLGLLSRWELLRVASLLTRDPRAAFAELPLTAAEEDVLRLVQDGLTNAEIAKMRARSARTIANQVASLLRKTGAASRRGLTQVSGEGQGA